MSSPRQKMVVVASPQPNELEQKKRRQTLERAKANHLSKQLQMRLQYAKLKVEHGWQRQNLNEVENLYFHHSHLRNMRQGAGQRPHYATVTHPPAPSSAPVPAETCVVQSPAPSGVLDQIAGPSPAANDASSDHISPPSQSPSEHADGRPSSQPSSQTQLYPSVQPTPVLVAPSSTPSTFDLSDPSILARLAQLQAQVQLPSQPQSQSQSQTLSRQSSTAIPPATSTSTSASHSTLVPVPIPAAPGVFPPHAQVSQPAMTHPQPGFAFAAYASQPPIGTSTPGSVPLYPMIVPAAPHNPAAPTQPPVPAAVPASASAPTAPMPTTPIPTPTSIAPTALTYDSFWSTHASSTGPTRALYRTHTGFTASATPAGNVAMLTPGGHAAVMTAEGVYVGGGSSRSG